MKITTDLHQTRVSEEEDDQFLKFIDYAKSILNETIVEGSVEPSWNWIAHRILKTCISYSSGVTPAILLSDLSQAWNEQNKGATSKKKLNFGKQLKKKQKREKLPSTITIDSIYEKKYLSLNSVIEAVILDAYLLSGTNIYILNLGDFHSSNSIELYLHQRFYMLADPENGILKKGREVVLTGCHLRIARGGSARLLPTEYFVILLDEEQDDDAMLLGAQFCSDSFSSITLEAVKQEVSYSLYTRIESIGPLEVQGKSGTLQMKQISLVDNDDVKLKFVLWGEQVLLANLLSVGSMLALDKPFIATSCSSALESCDEICLEYGSATHLYLVPLVQHEEKVVVALTQFHSQGSRLLDGIDPSQGSLISQVTLPCDSQGSIDFSNYPFRSCSHLLLIYVTR